MDNLDIICIGESLIELSTNESITHTEFFSKYYGGDTITTAVAATKLGSKVGYISRIGNDNFKDFLLDCWQAENIDISNVKLVDGINGLYFVSVQESGRREFTYYRRKSAATNLSIDDIDSEYIETSGIVYSTGITQSLSSLSKEAVKKAFFIAKGKGIKTAYDPNYTPRLWNVEEAKEALEEIIENIDIIFLNTKHDAEKLIELTSCEKIIKYFWDRGVSMVIVKEGEEGCFVGYNGEINHIDAVHNNVVDTTCAGDAFNGAFLHGIASGLTPFEAGKLAVIVSGFQVQKLGAIKSLPSKEEVFAEFESV
ncbi:MAG: sugar kinase [Candidatus Gastranaerophilales bacterium]|nr:sugar kinase [Candidatus Gastranaerophilales bacterium]